MSSILGTFSFFLRVFLLVAITVQLSTPIIAVDITWRTFPKREDYDVTSADTTVSFQNITSMVQCFGACIENLDCLGFKYSGNICYNYEGIRALSKSPLTNVYTVSDRELLIFNGFIFRNGRWIKLTHKDTLKLTPPLAAQECTKLIGNGMLFMMKVDRDVLLFLSLTERDDEYWIGMNDAEDESQDGFGTWKWQDGSTVQDIYGDLIKFKDDNDDKDYVLAKNKEEDYIEAKFFKVDEEKGFICECTI